MFFEIIKWSMISFILIVLVHYLFIFFKDNLTIPKTKDLVTKPLEEYKTMETIIDNNFSKLKNNNKNNNNNNNNINNNNNNNLDGTTMLNNLLPNQSITNINGTTNIQNFNSEDNMKNELKSFFTNLNDI